ncbi:hypothetical protein BX600DRAFT_95725 [Xylariales sp. PMI_506]|nr:hypothetical protein BX600DRAFT_95725 [Xylariales sp. PMI_506]
MRVAWYAGSSAALAAGVVTYAFNQRANFYSAMVYLSQNNLSLMILINLILLVYGTFVYGLQRLCYGQLRPVEIEQLYEKAWFAVTETCLAMTIFREEVGAWFLVMFTALVTGKVWEWIGEGRVEILEQQPPANPRLFHTRLSISLILSVLYDIYLFTYAVNTVIQQARPNMMVMFLFEFAILTTCSFRTGLRYLLSLVEIDIVNKQTRQRLEERRKQLRDQRADILRRRESEDSAEAEAANQEELPEEDVDEMDIEVPGWESKGQWVLTLDLVADFVKLGVYVGFFAVLMMFYGLPIHIMRDLFLTTRSFLKRLSALIRYRKALQDMNKYPDATQEELAREDTCIICREEMRPWDPAAPGAVERSRPKKLPCGHILHLGCLKGWLERQQVCPTCRRSVVIDGAAPNGDGVVRINLGGQGQAPGQVGGNNGPPNGNQAQQPRQGGMRMFQFGPVRLAFAQGNRENVQDLLAQGFGGQVDGANAQPAPVRPAATPQPQPPTSSGASSMSDMSSQLQDIAQRLQQEIFTLQTIQAELHTTYALMAELQRLRLLQQQQQQAPGVNGSAVGHSGHLFNNGQSPVPLQPIFGQPQPPFMSNFSAFPQRINAPTVSRHVPHPNSAAIPAGSPDLPEGVVLPQGWSLMPLQRVEAQQLPMPSNVTIPPAETVVQPIRATPAVGDENVSHPPNATSHSGSIHTESREPSTDALLPTIESGVQANAPPVAAPTPVLPNWGGAAQLFSDRAGGAPSASPAESSQKSQTTADTHDDSDEEDEEASSGSGDKGKAKAVTVEDEEDDDIYM